MSRLLKALCLLMIGIWLPATQHCSLAASGMLHEEPEACCNTDHTCSLPNCDTLKGSSLSAPQLHVKAPVLPELGPAFGMLFCQIVFIPSAIEVLPDLPPREAIPLGLISRWNFDRRTALPARAPSMLAVV